MVLTFVLLAVVVTFAYIGLIHAVFVIVDSDSLLIRAWVFFFLIVATAPVLISLIDRCTPAHTLVEGNKVTDLLGDDAE